MTNYLILPNSFYGTLSRYDISLSGIRQRENIVLTICKKHNIPVVTVIGGGYDDDRYALARRHAIVTEEAFSIFKD